MVNSVRREEEAKSVLTREMDDQILSRMPLWFRRLRDRYNRSQTNEP